MAGLGGHTGLASLRLTPRVGHSLLFISRMGVVDPGTTSGQVGLVNGRASNPAVQVWQGVVPQRAEVRTRVAERELRGAVRRVRSGVR